MSFFRNPEIKIMTRLMLVISLVFCTTGFIISIGCGILTFMLCTVFCVLFLYFTYKRYERIGKMAGEIDRILHDDNIMSITLCNEGELAILQDEIAKLVTAFREQTDSMRKDRIRLSDSIADISHQIRTPMTSINLITSFLSEPELPDDRRFQLVSEMNKLLSRIDWQINTLLKLSKLDAGTAKFKHECVNVLELMKLIKVNMDIPMELREQQLELDIDSEASFTGDIEWSNEAFSNIIKDCMEHTPVGGRISITAVQNPLYTGIVIRDNGSGIDNEDLPHIFERFYKGKNASEQSIGIGLALARMIISEQNGTIKAENSREGGAIFTVHFYQNGGTV